jgi:uncharacterized DUF497 family protein
MEWTWDTDKNRENIRKHGFSFETALLVFGDHERAEREDDYQYEERWQTIGTVDEVYIIVIHTLKTSDGEPGRIISARQALPYERRRYQEGTWSS